MLIRPFQESDADAVVELWQVCGLTRPWNDPHLDIARKLDVQRELFLVGVEVGVEADDAVIASAMGGYEGHRGWVNYLAVGDPTPETGVGAGVAATARNGPRS